MSTVLVESPLSDDERRARLFAGELFVYAPKPSTVAFVEFTRELVREAFGDLDPETAQYHMPVEEYAALLAEFKPRFIHHPRCKELIRDLLIEHGADPEKTYFDVPRLRTSTSDDYLTSGIAYAFHPHRDTWYSAPFCQLNWWFPVFDIVPDNGLAFHPKYFTNPVKNSSETYNYYEWNATNRASAATHVKSDTRVQPKPQEEVELFPQTRVVAPSGGTLIFSAQQLHSSVPNTSGRTRFSVDFRTVHLDDVVGHVGAPNVDSACTGTTMRDYLKAADSTTHLSEELCLEYDEVPPKADAMLVYGASR
ncbi:hypothetical protein I6A84_40930 [Frankia sp. CNm7]|uniref:Phytanoyl-CoA dioxygenase family protein n=1 Tax=Frankia nepalensis TaxID=1836974 RepID=A0A937RF55_9ACTN|nr:hypothetical protein [Frankia nepalensis]MBL7498565.1 hypothetical protein [Frankia nepalensis]MBL7513766.1 hypothetical protein [Frankia nepalensis]MBL7524238.1 hypothetical protein [Frankia nepalensis]MBL7626274.1 hypothetical protein [Frankia nepalensis]